MDIVEEDLRDIAKVLSRKPGHLVWRLYQKAWNIFCREAQKINVTPVQEVSLLVIRKLPNIDQKTLSDITALDRATAGSVLKRLEARRLIIRRPDPADGRAKLLKLSSKGEELCDKLMPIAQKSADAFLAPLSKDERLEFIRLLKKLTGFPD